MGEIKAKLAECKIFSKMDLKSAFWQIELDETSRYVTVFHANDNFFRYKRLTMGLRPSQGELTLKPIFAHINNVHLIHDDVIIATRNMSDHIKGCQKSDGSGETLNPDKCHFGSKEIKFWGMIYSAEGMKPDPAKVDALKYISPPSNKDDLISFLCMMQSNADFIENFAQKATPLRELTQNKTHFKWILQHQKCFEQLLQDFRKDTLLRYFDMKKKIYIFTDAHISGLGAIL